MVVGKVKLTWAKEHINGMSYNNPFIGVIIKTR